MDLAPHGLDLVDFLLGEPIADLAALTQSRVQDYAVDDGALLIGRTGCGRLASLHVAYNCPDALPRRRLEVVGTKGMLVAENTMGQTAGGSLLFIDGPAAARSRSPSTPTARLHRAGARLRLGPAPARGAAGVVGIPRPSHHALVARAYGQG